MVKMMCVVSAAVFLCACGVNNNNTPTDGGGQVPSDGGPPVACVAETQACDPFSTCCRGKCSNGRCQCKTSGFCDGNSDCCTGYTCSGGTCGGEAGTPCGGNLDCAVQYVCNLTSQKCAPCLKTGETCTASVECCGRVPGCGFDKKCG